MNGEHMEAHAELLIGANVQLDMNSYEKYKCHVQMLNLINQMKCEHMGAHAEIFHPD